jgi:hypothetical protein
MNQIFNNYNLNPSAFVNRLNPSECIISAYTTASQTLYAFTAWLFMSFSNTQSGLAHHQIQQLNPIKPEDQSNWTNQDLAANALQKIWRGYTARRGYLSNPGYAIYQPQCKSVLEGTEMPRASSGNTQVYFPPATPSIILKQSGKQEAIDRFSGMQRVLHILRSQGSSHLVIPRAALCGPFLVEDRLPISSDDYINMQRYIDNPRAFDEAVLEMTRLFSKVHLTDLVSRQIHPISNIVGNTIRYDNLPLYIENGVGKIGLIDLEHIVDTPSSPGNRDFGFSVPSSPSEILARIFPYHVDIIVEESNKLKMACTESHVRRSAKQGYEFLQKGYIDHLNWLQQKKITTQNFNQFFEITPNRIEMIVENLTEKFLRRKNIIGIITKNLTEIFLRKNVPCLTQELIDQSVRIIISDIETVLLDTESVTIPSTIDTDADLVFFRSPTFKRIKLYSNLMDHFESLDNWQNWKNWRALYENVIRDLIESTCNELVKGGEIFSYDPNYRSECHELCWIRY